MNTNTNTLKFLTNKHKQHPFIHVRFVNNPSNDVGEEASPYPSPIGPWPSAYRTFTWFANITNLCARFSQVQLIVIK